MISIELWNLDRVAAGCDHFTASMLSSLTGVAPAELFSLAKQDSTGC